VAGYVKTEAHFFKNDSIQELPSDGIFAKAGS